MKKLQSLPDLTTLHPASEWNEDIGDVLWWQLPISEAPYVGTPNDLGLTVEVVFRTHANPDGHVTRHLVGGWPGYHTHWSHLPIVELWWEARSARRYGSKHEGWFQTKDGTMAFALGQIQKAGGVGKIRSIVDRVVYYTEFEDDM